MKDILECPDCGGYGERYCLWCSGKGKLSIANALFLAERQLTEAREEIDRLREVIEHKQEHISALYDYQYKTEPVITIEVTKNHIRKGYLDGSWEHPLTLAVREKFGRAIAFDDCVCVGHYDFTHRAELPPEAVDFAKIKYKKRMTPFTFDISLEEIVKKDENFIKDLEEMERESK